MSDSFVGLSASELEVLLEYMVVLSAPKDSMVSDSGGSISWWGVLSKGELKVLRGKTIATQRVVQPRLAEASAEPCGLSAALVHEAEAHKWGTAMKKLRIVTGFRVGDRSRGRFATLHDCSPYSHVHARREILGFVRCSRAIFCPPLPQSDSHSFHRCVVAATRWQVTTLQPGSMVGELALVSSKSQASLALKTGPAGATIYTMPLSCMEKVGGWVTASIQSALPDQTVSRGFKMSS